MNRKQAAKRRRLAARSVAHVDTNIVMAPEPVAPATPPRWRLFLKNPVVQLLAGHPILWFIAGVVIFSLWATTLPAVSWNIEEMMIARNLLRGNGYVMAPLDPPLLARPPLAPLVCAVIELFTLDPRAIYAVFYTLALTTFLVCGFYIAKTIWDLGAAHLACAFVLTSPALTFQLINHVHSMSHVAFLLAIGPAILSTVLVTVNPSPTRLVTAGLCWGLCYLARWETLLFFVVSLGTVAYFVWTKRAGRRAMLGTVLMLASFLALFIPYKLFESHARARYGIWGPSELTTFYASEAWVFRTDSDEPAGYDDAVHKYGTVESNNDSLVRAVMRNPQAAAARVRVNVARFLVFFTTRDYFDPLWAVFGIIFAISTVWGRRSYLFLVYFVLLFACTTTICLFHIDKRYLTIAVPSLLFLICGGFSVSWSASRPVLIRAFMVAAVCLLCVRGVKAARAELGATLSAYMRRTTSMDVTKAVAGNFRQAMRDNRPWCLGISIPAKLNDSFGDFFLSYFAGTAIGWGSQPADGLPYDKIFSKRPKTYDYIYVPEDALYTTDVLSKHKVVSSLKHPEAGNMYLFAGNLPDLQDVRSAKPVEQEQLRSILRRDYPGLAKTYQEIIGIEPALTSAHGSLDRVGCSVLGFGGRPNGRSNRVFKLSLPLNEAKLAGSGDHSVTAIELLREDPWGIFATSNEHYLLGVTKQLDGPVINKPDGSIDVHLDGSTDLWLYACDDGVNAPGSRYRARVRIGDAAWMETRVLRDLTAPEQHGAP